MLDNLLLLSGDDIPFPQARITIHPPKLREIGFIGEENFFMGCELLNFSKDILSSEDKSSLEQYEDFEVLMSMMNDRHNSAMAKQTISTLMVLNLMFPTYKIRLTKNTFSLTDEQGQEFFIDKKTFPLFREMVAEMFCLKKKEADYNPAGSLSKKIADQMRQGQIKRDQSKSGDAPKKVSILNRYASILAVGEHKDLNELMNYTVYQLNDEFQRFELNDAHELYIRLKLAGAKDVKEVEDWMKELHP